MKNAAITQPINAAGPAMVKATKEPNSQPDPSVVPAETHSKPKNPTSRRSPSSVRSATRTYRMLIAGERPASGPDGARGARTHPVSLDANAVGPVVTLNNTARSVIDEAPPATASRQPRPRPRADGCCSSTIITAMHFRQRCALESIRTDLGPNRDAT